jgi:tetratricopeptide (TPR) repeat protein
VLALIPVAWLIARGIRRGDAIGTRRWAWAAFFGLVYLGLHQIFDFYPNMPAVMLLAAIPVAMLDAASDRRMALGRWADEILGARTRLASIARGALWLACLVAVVVLVRTESVARTHEQALASIYAYDWNAARGPAEQAAAADPDMTAYQVTRGLVASALQDWPTAADAYALAAQADDMPQSWLGLAQAEIELGIPAVQVRGHIERARRLGIQQPAITYAAGALYDRMGQSEAADEAYASAVAALPSLAGDGSWGTDPVLAPRWDDIRNRALTLAPTRAWEIALTAGQISEARTLAREAPDAALAGLVVEAWAGDSVASDQSRAQIYGLAEVSASDPEVLSWATRLATREGDHSEAARYQRLAVFEVTEGGALPGTEVRVDPDGWFRLVPAGTRVGFAGHYLYRRPLPPDLLPPGLPRLVHEARP